jgi:PIN domain nuclease of toxin-antitoxin system
MVDKTYLLDTHCLLWFQDNSPKIPKRVMSIIQDTGNKVLFSQISLFEIAIKQKIGKLPAFISNINDIYDQAIRDNFIF